MLKTILTGLGAISLVILFVVTTPEPVFAIQGTCSSHGGVNCSAGPDWDGSAICNDGWRDSSEIFADQVMCSSSSHSCTSAELNAIDQKYNIDSLNAQAKDIVNQIAAVNAQLEQTIINATDPHGNNTTMFGANAEIDAARRQASSQLLGLSASLSAINGNIATAQSSANQECQALGWAEYAKLQVELLKQQQAAIQQSQQTQNIPQYTCPSNSILSGNQCVCSSGTSWDGASCTAAVQSQSIQQVTPTDPYAGATQDERCVKLGYGTFYNTDKQSCDSCPSGTARIAGTNNCRQPIPAASIQVQSIPAVKTTNVMQPSLIESSTTSRGYQGIASTTATAPVKQSVIQRVFSWFLHFFKSGITS